MKIWIVSMECSGIVEAGGVKDVTLALCEHFSKAGNEVTLFIPVFKTNCFDSVKNFKKDVFSASVSLCGQENPVTYSTGEFVNFPCKIVFVNHLAFAEKRAVYVYTATEEKENPEHVRGTGHKDFHFLDCLLSKAATEYVKFLPKNKEPDVIHCQDASCAITPCFAELLRPEHFENTRCFVTIHNAGPAYHHEFSNIDEAFHYSQLPWAWLSDSLNGNRVEPFLLASHFATLTTVSDYYAQELVNPQNDVMTDGLSSIFSLRKIDVKGITNGIDYYHYAPEFTEISLLPYSMKPTAALLSGKYKNREYFLKLCDKNLSELEYENSYLYGLKRFGYLDEEVPGEDTVYYVHHGRLVWQKGITLLIEVMRDLLPQDLNVRFMVLGQGDPQIEAQLSEISEAFPGKVVYFRGYNGHMARLSVASADFSVFPSLFEPCCLEDFISQIYGTIPIAHATGGLKKVIDGETGFLFYEHSKEEFEKAILKAYNLCRYDYDTLKMMIYWTSNFIRSAYSWEFVAKEKYLKLFSKKVKKN